MRVHVVLPSLPHGSEHHSQATVNSSSLVLRITELAGANRDLYVSGGVRSKSNILLHPELERSRRSHSLKE